MVSQPVPRGPGSSHIHQISGGRPPWPVLGLHECPQHGGASADSKGTLTGLVPEIQSTWGKVFEIVAVIFWEVFQEISSISVKDPDFQLDNGRAAAVFFHSLLSSKDPWGPLGFAESGKPSPSTPFIFNGDFVDRGSWSIEAGIAGGTPMSSRPVTRCNMM